MSPSLIRIVFGFMFAFSLSVFTPPPSFGQTPAEIFDDTQKVAHIGLALSDLENRALDLFEHPDFKFLIENIAENTDTRLMSSKFENWMTYKDKEISDIKTASSRLQATPVELTDRDLIEVLNARKHGLVTMIDSIEESLNKTDTLFKGAIHEDDVDLAALSIIQIESFQRILIAESKSISQSLAGTGEDHPQIELSQQSILTNDFMLPFMDIQIKYLKDENSLTDRELEIRKMESVLKSYKKSIRSGQKKKDNFSRRLIIAKGFSSDEPTEAEIDFAINVINAYQPSFKTEDKILDSLKDTVVILKRDKIYDDIEEDLDTPMNKVYALIDERLKHDAARQTLIANGQ